jgi:hypothetical protein
MLVTLPFVLLLLDYWPLERLEKRTVAEKWRFFVVAFVFAIVAYISQSRTAGVKLPAEYGPARIPLTLCHNIIFYLWKIVWPVDLSPYYPFPKPLGLSNPMVLAGIVGTCILVVLLVISLRWTRAALIGWLFFFVAILPTMQVVAFSDTIASPKFAYMPSIGLVMALMAFLVWWWGKADGSVKHTARRIALVVVVLALAAAETVATRRYLVHWRDTESYYEYILRTHPNSTLALNNYGNAVLRKDDHEKAIQIYNRALQIDPDDPLVHFNLGNALRAQNRLDEAVSHYRRALQLEPSLADVHNNLGTTLAAQGRLDEAIRHFRRALEVAPTFAPARFNLEKALVLQGSVEQSTQ